LKKCNLWLKSEQEGKTIHRANKLVNPLEALLKISNHPNTGSYGFFLRPLLIPKERSIAVTKARKKANPSSPKLKSSTETSPDSRLQESAEETSSAQSVDKIREIIFGNQMQDYDKRFVRLEDELHKRHTELRDATHKRLDAIETFIKKEIEALKERLKNEQSMRDASTKKMSKEFKDSMQLLTKNIEQLEEKHTKDTRDLRQQIRDASKKLTNDIAEKQAEAAQSLKRAYDELDEDKVARTTLSELLLELAVRTSNELAEKFDLTTDDLKDE
jgi:Skp family chaperone for outer membrane proteins